MEGLTAPRGGMKPAQIAEAEAQRVAGQQQLEAALAQQIEGQQMGGRLRRPCR